MNEIECPECGEWLEVGENAIQVTCLDCQRTWNIDRDGEFRDGSWRDLTKLYPVESEAA